MRNKVDFKDDGSYSDRVGKIVGGLNPVADARDIVADSKRVWDGEKGGWIKLGATVLGAVPIVGDAGKALIKTEEKAIIKGLEKSAEKEIAEESAENIIKTEAKTELQTVENTVNSVKNLATELPEAYKTAKSGGKHAGTLKNYENLPTGKIEKAMRGYEKQVQEHIDKLANPSKYAERWNTMIKEEQAGLLNKWTRDRDRNQELADVMRGILEARK